MALFDDLTKKAAKFAEQAIDKTKEVADLAELKLRRKNLESDLEATYATLGKYYFEHVLTVDNEITELVTLKGQIIDLKNKIEAINLEIEEVKKD